MAALTDFLPPGDGLLPYYMTLLSVISVGNSIQNFMTLHFTRRVYNARFVPNTNLPPKTASFDPEDSVNKLVPAQLTGKSSPSSSAKDQATPLAARLFGTWTMLTAIVRLYVAYNLRYGPMYDLGWWTYVVAFCHFSSELFVFKSMTFGKPQLFPFIFASCALVWMPLQRSHYVQQL